jgi:hypothetical protein
MTRYYPLWATLCAILAVLLIWSTGVQSALFAPQEAGKPAGVAQVRIDESRLDLGTIAAGTTPKARFRVSNAGTRRLVLRPEGGPCCGQPADHGGVTIVPPGKSATLVVDVPTAGIQGGLQREIVYATNDPQMPRLTLTVVGRVGAPGE